MGGSSPDIVLRISYESGRIDVDIGRFDNDVPCGQTDCSTISLLMSSEASVTLHGPDRMSCIVAQQSHSVPDIACNELAS